MSKADRASPVAVVTGGSRGIGRAVAVALARQGWNVCFSYVANAAAAEATAASVKGAGRRALVVKADVANREDIKRLFEAAIKEFGRLDALVNNAGIVGETRSILDADDAHLTAVFRTNVLGSFFCVSEAARLMSTQRGGRGGAIVNMSSAAARHGGMPNEAHYAASKGAIDSFTLALAKELAPHGIRVNAVRPGLISTRSMRPMAARNWSTASAPWCRSGAPARPRKWPRLWPSCQGRFPGMSTGRWWTCPAVAEAADSFATASQKQTH